MSENRLPLVSRIRTGLSTSARSRGLVAFLTVVTLLAVGAVAPASATGSTTQGVANSARSSTTTESEIANSVSLSQPSSDGAIRSVRSSAVWGGKNGKAVKKGRSVSVKTKTKNVPGSARTVLLQVQVLNAKRAGTIEVRAAGTKRTKTPAVAFDKGNSSTTVLVKRSPKGKVTVRSSVKTRLRISVIGYISGSGKKQGPGGTQATQAYRLVDSGSKVGSAQLRKGKSGSVSVLGLGGVPTTGVRAVWLQVQTRGKGKGSVSVRRAGGGSSGAAVAPYLKGWGTTLVLAPVDAQGRITYSVKGKPLRALRISMVGWVAETDATSGLATATGGLVPVAARKLKLRKAKSTKQLVRRSVKTTVAGVPTQTGRVLLRVETRVGKKAGTVRVGTSASAVTRAKSTGVPVSARDKSTLTVVAPVSSAGRVFVSAPKGSTVKSVVVLGYIAGPVAKSRDKSRPSVTITSPAAGARIQLAKTPVVTISGTVRDDQSGPRLVAVYGGSTLIGSAVVDTTVVPARWSIETSMPAGSQKLRVRAINGAGRETSATRDVRANIPSTSETVVAPQVEVLTAAQRAAVTKVLPNKLRWRGSLPSNIHVGSVLVSEPTKNAPQGFLRRVDALSSVGNEVVVVTSDASLTDVFMQLDLHWKQDAADSGAQQNGMPQDKQPQRAKDGGQTGSKPAVEASVSQSFTAKIAGTLPFSILASSTGQHAGTPTEKITASINLDASAKFTLEARIKIGVKWRWFKLPEVTLEDLRLGYAYDFRSTAGVSASGRMTSPKQERRLTRFLLGTIVIPAGPVPIPFTAGLQPVLFGSVSIEARVTGLQLTSSSSGKAGLQLKNGKIEPYSERRASSTFNPALGEASIKATVAAGFKAEVDISLFNLVGPKLAVSAAVELSVKVAVSCMAKGGGTISLEANLDAVIGITAGGGIQGFGGRLSVSFTLAELRWNLVRQTLQVDADLAICPRVDEPDPTEPDPDPTDPDPTDPDPTDPDPTDPDPDDPEFEVALPDVPPGKVWALGDNTYGELGDGSDTPSLTPVAISELGEVVQLDAGTWSGYALKRDGTVWAWGGNHNGQLGDGTTEDRSVPVKVKDLSNIVAIAAGPITAYALKSDGTVWAWGYNGSRLGDGDADNEYENALIPVRVAALDKVTAIASNGYTGFALKSNGTVWSWGQLSKGIQIPSGPSYRIFRGVPTQVSNLANVVAISGGLYNGYALKSDGTVWSWGHNDGGRLGVWTNSQNRDDPVHVSTLSGIESIGSGDRNGYAIAADGAVWAWGNNSFGQLGNGEELGSVTPIRVPALDGVDSIVGGDVSAYGLLSDGTAVGWGSNHWGHLNGDASVDILRSPVPIPVPGQIVGISGTGSTTYVLVADN